MTKYLFVFFILIGCGVKESGTLRRTENSAVAITTITHNECEFVVATSPSGVAMIHDPMCDNPLHEDEDAGDNFMTKK